MQIFVFSGLVIGWWSKLWAGHPYPTQISVPPPEWACHSRGLCGCNSAGHSDLYSLFRNEKKGGSNVLLTKVMSFFNHCYLKRSTVKMENFSPRNPQCNKINMDFYLLSWTVIKHHRIFISSWSCPLFSQKPKSADWLMCFRLLQWIFMSLFWLVCRNLMGSYEFVLWWCDLWRGIWATHHLMRWFFLRNRIR